MERTFITTAELLGSAVRALSVVSSAIDGGEGGPFGMAGVGRAVEWLEDGYCELDEAVGRLHEAIVEDWEHTENNRAKLDQLQRFRKEYNLFKEAVMRLDNAYIDFPKRAEEVTGNEQLSRSYIVMLCRWEEMFSVPFLTLDELQNRYKDEYRPYMGMEREMMDYFSGLNDLVLEDALLLHDFPAIHGIWKGPTTTATYFGRHFHLSAAQMNDIFDFYTRDGQRIKLNYSKYPDTHIGEDADIAHRLKKFKYIKPIK